MTVLLTVGTIAVAMLLWAAVHGRLVRLRRQVLADWRRLEAVRRRRHDLAADMAAAAGRAPAVDRAVIEALTRARERAATAHRPADAAAFEHELAGVLSHLMTIAATAAPPAVLEAVRAGLAALRPLEGELARARIAYNAAAAHYNRTAARFPGSVVAAVAGFSRAQAFNPPSAARTETPAEEPAPPPGPG